MAPKLSGHKRYLQDGMPIIGFVLGIVMIVSAQLSWGSNHIMYSLPISCALLALISFLCLMLMRAQTEAKHLSMQIEQRDAKLSRKRSDNEHLLAEIDQRLKNNLQTIIGLTNFAHRRVADGRQDGLTALSGLQGRLQAMAIIQRALSHRSGATTISARMLLLDLLQHQMKQSPQITDLEVATNGATLDAVLAGPVGLIFHEMGEQAADSCFNRQACVVVIELAEENHAQRLTLKARGDNFNLKKHLDADSLGRKIILMLCEQIDATFEVSNEKEGATWTLTYNRVQ